VISWFQAFAFQIQRAPLRRGTVFNFADIFAAIHVGGQDDADESLKFITRVAHQLRAGLALPGVRLVTRTVLFTIRPARVVTPRC
jgi:hypothetical protein